MACSVFKVLLRTFLDIGHADMAQIFCEGTSRRPLSRCRLSAECRCLVVRRPLNALPDLLPTRRPLSRCLLSILTAALFANGRSRRGD